MATVYTNVSIKETDLFHIAGVVLLPVFFIFLRSYVQMTPTVFILFTNLKMNNNSSIRYRAYFDANVFIHIS